MNETEHIEIRSLNDDELQGAYAPIARDYLEEKSLERWCDERRANPELTAGCFLNGRLIGLCYGLPDLPDGVVLEGIAMLEGYAGRGIGSRLLQYFERQIQEAGYTVCSLGSAGGYVEHFYIKNGYRPSKFACWVSGDYDLSPELKSKYRITEKHQGGGSRRLSVEVDHLDNDLRDRMKADLGVDDIIPIMYKVF
jgi:GNAT superfamily N-acetyltransferase